MAVVAPVVPVADLDLRHKVDRADRVEPAVGQDNLDNQGLADQGNLVRVDRADAPGNPDLDDPNNLHPVDKADDQDNLVLAGPEDNLAKAVNLDLVAQTMKADSDLDNLKVIVHNKVGRDPTSSSLELCSVMKTVTEN